VETIEIQITGRETIGSSNSRRLRKAGQLPAVVYQPGGESVSVTLDRHSFIMSARGKPHTQIFMFKGESDLNGKLSLVKDVQIEPIKGQVMHVEFIAVAHDHNVVVSVPVTVTGVPNSVKEGTATLNQTAYDISIECFPTAIPEGFTVDASKLAPGDSIHASDIPLPENISLKSPSGLTIVTAMVDRKSKVAEVEEETAAVAATPAAEPAAKK